MKIALLGYGKMGKEIEHIALQRGHIVVSKFDSSTAANITKATLAQADVAIEFTNPASVIKNIYTCFDANLPVVVGSTGWLDQLEEVKKRCAEKQQSLFYASNFSIGVAIFSKINKYLASIMNHYPDYEVAMEEIHHIHKKDSPSGTGLTLANQILERIDRKTKWVEANKPALNELNIVAKREGEIPGTHIIKYTSAIDDIEISHVAHNRKGFATGAVLAAEWLVGKKGIFTMDDLLKF